MCKSVLITILIYVSLHCFKHFQYIWDIISRKFDSMGCLGLCLDGLSTCWLLGGPLEGRGVPRFGRWCPLAPFGVYIGKETIGVLRTWRDS